MDVAIAGASGFVGRALTARLLDHGHGVVALGRSATSLSTEARTVDVDVGDEVAIRSALAGVDAAYYLVHSMAAGGEFRAARSPSGYHVRPCGRPGRGGPYCLRRRTRGNTGLGAPRKQARGGRSPRGLRAPPWSNYVQQWCWVQAASPSKCCGT